MPSFQFFRPVTLQLCQLLSFFYIWRSINFKFFEFKIHLESDDFSPHILVPAAVCLLLPDNYASYLVLSCFCFWPLRVKPQHNGEVVLLRLWPYYYSLFTTRMACIFSVKASLYSILKTADHWMSPVSLYFTSLALSPTTILCSLPPGILALLFLEEAGHVTALGPLHLIFPLPEVFFLCRVQSILSSSSF